MRQPRLRPREREAAVARDHLAGDPRRLVASEPGDQPGRVLRRAPAAEREPAHLERRELGRGPARVGRARVDRVDADPARREVGGERAVSPWIAALLAA